MNIKPKPGRLVRDPQTGRDVTGPLTVADGDPFWLRRLADGDVELDAPVEARAVSKPDKKERTE
jgi:hypothetical protein